MNVQSDSPRRHRGTENSGGVEPRNTRKGKGEEVVRPLKGFIQCHHTIAEDSVERQKTFHRFPTFSVYSVYSVCSVVQLFPCPSLSTLPPCLRASVVNSPLTSWNRKAVR